MTDELRQVLDYLARIEKRLENIEGRLAASGAPSPACLRYREAADRLGVGLTTLKQMIRDKEIRTIRIGRVPMVPLSEIHRASTPAPDRPRFDAATRKATWVPIVRPGRRPSALNGGTQDSDALRARSKPRGSS